MSVFSSSERHQHECHGQALWGTPGPGCLLLPRGANVSGPGSTQVCSDGTRTQVWRVRRGARAHTNTCTRASLRPLYVALLKRELGDSLLQRESPYRSWTRPCLPSPKPARKSEHRVKVLYTPHSGDSLECVCVSVCPCVHLIAQG